MPERHDILPEDERDHVVSGLLAALNLEQGIKYYMDRVPGLDGPWHFARIREALQARLAELRSRERNPEKGEIWSVFVLSDDSTWEQPSYRIPRDLTLHEFEQAAIRDCGGFLAVGAAPDPDCEEEYARDLPT